MRLLPVMMLKACVSTGIKHSFLSGPVLTGTTWRRYSWCFIMDIRVPPAGAASTYGQKLSTLLCPHYMFARRENGLLGVVGVVYWLLRTVGLGLGSGLVSLWTACGQCGRGAGWRHTSISSCDSDSEAFQHRSAV